MIRRSWLLAFLGACCLSWLGCGGDDSGASPDADGGVIGNEGGVMTAMPCQNSLMCPKDQVCDTAAGSCVECLIKADCPMGTECQSSHCVMPAAACTNSLACKADLNNPICDTSTGKCVPCVASTDCPMNNDCVEHACKPFTACMNSLGCPQGQVCDPTRMRCVECVGTNDCPMNNKCVGNVCRVSCMSDTQCTVMRQLCDLTQGICAQCIGAGDCKPEQFCSNGACAPDVCVASTTSCMTNSVVTCRADGSGYGSPVSCGSQVCVPTGTTAACKSTVCTASVVACTASGTQVIKCSADGLSQTVQNDCAANNQICVSAQCVTGVCSPGKRFCSGNESRQCSVAGDTSTLVQTCLPTQYCEAATGTCKTKVCTENAAACNGRIVTTCNADGSGFVVGGTDCTPKYCSAGACVDYLFHEDFEDGDLVGWINGTGTYSSRMVVPTMGAASTANSLYLAKSVATSSYTDGVYQTFATPLAPSSVSWYARVPTLAPDYSAIVTLHSSVTVGLSYQLVRVYFNFTGYIVLTDATGALSQKIYTPNVWYHLELRNISWINRTFDFYIDGVLTKTGAVFTGTGNAISRIDLGSYYNGDSAYFDQIDFLP